MTRLNLYTAKGTKKSSVSLPKRFQEDINKKLLAQAIRVYEARSHPHLAKTKTRGEIRASKAKIYRQKGTGRARHGARSAPIFVGGGVTHGPKGIKRELTLPKKMRQKAFRSALTLKAKNGEIVVVEGISTLKKTKEAATLIDKIAGKETQMKQNGRVTFVLSDKNSSAKLALRNLKNVNVVRFSDLNAYRVYFGGILVIDKEALEESREGSRGRTDSRESIKGRKSTKGIKGKSVKSVSKSV